MPDNVGDGLNVYKYYSIIEILKFNREPCAKVNRYSKKFAYYVISAAKPSKDIILGMFNEYNGQLDLIIQHGVFWAI